MEAVFGIIGTVIGTFLGWILNNFSNSGKLNIYVSSAEEQYRMQDNCGGMVSCNSQEQVQSFTFSASFDLYNSSGNTKIMRKVLFVFSDGKKDLVEFVPRDKTTERFSSGMWHSDEVSPINIPPKTVSTLNLSCGVWKQKDNLDFLWKTKKVFLCYKDEKDKQKRILIKAKDFGKHFETLSK